MSLALSQKCHMVNDARLAVGGITAGADVVFFSVGNVGRAQVNLNRAVDA